MNSKILIAAGLVIAFVMGTMAQGFYNSTTQAFTPAEENTTTSTRTVKTTPRVARTNYVAAAPRRVATVEDRQPVTERKKKRSLEREILIVGGSAGAGTAIGAVAGGKKGAAVGAISGGIAGLVYDLATRN